MNRLPLIITIAGVVVLCSLGVWQLKRLAWKEAVLDRIEARAHRPAQRIKVFLPGQDLDYVHAELEGKFITSQSFFLRPRVYEQKSGAHMLSILALPALKQVIFVNRGWVPDGYVSSETDMSVQVFKGILKKYSPEKSMFVPHNVPDKDEWYWADLSAMAEKAGVSRVVPYVFYQDKGEGGGYPIGGQLRLDLPNNHLAYALFWFAMAGALGIVYVLYNRSDKAP